MTKRSLDELTTTSYAILGLLAIRSWTTYELAKQMDRSLRRYWPRAASRVYEEPKRLVSLGLATAERQRVGRRPRTLYSITGAGRRALRAWLDEPGAGPSLECEALLKVFYAEQTTPVTVLVQIEALREWAERELSENVGFARLYVEGGGPFPDRVRAMSLTGRFRVDFADMVLEWAQWAHRLASDFGDDPADSDAAWHELRSIAARDVPGVAPPPG